jgi:hypothetical protein
LPRELLEIVNRILDEEVRHVVFFANWLAHGRRQPGRGARSSLADSALRGYGRALGRALGASRTAGALPTIRYFPRGVQSILANLTIGTVALTCLTEYEHRMSSVDPELLRPRALAVVARIALVGLYLFDRQLRSITPDSDVRR